MAAVYGIANCDSVKKARAWLAGRGIGAEFVDFKKEKPTEGMVRSWLAQIPLSVLLNRRGTTWRNLDDVQKRQAEDVDGAVALMCAMPGLIKRPVLEVEGHFYCGFDEAVYNEVFLGEPE